MAFACLFKKGLNLFCPPCPPSPLGEGEGGKEKHLKKGYAFFYFVPPIPLKGGTGGESKANKAKAGGQGRF